MKKSIGLWKLNFLGISMLIQGGFLSSVVAFAEPQVDADKFITGENASVFIDSLLELGVKDTTGLIGALHLDVKKIECFAERAQAAVPSCTLTVNGSLEEAGPLPAKRIYDILRVHGALVSDDVDQYVHILATDVSCSRIVVPDATGDCVFK